MSDPPRQLSPNAERLIDRAIIQLCPASAGPDYDLTPALEAAARARIKSAAVAYLAALDDEARAHGAPALRPGLAKPKIKAVEKRAASLVAALDQLAPTVSALFWADIRAQGGAAPNIARLRDLVRMLQAEASGLMSDIGRSKRPIGAENPTMVLVRACIGIALDYSPWAHRTRRGRASIVHGMTNEAGEFARFVATVVEIATGRKITPGRLARALRAAKDAST